jgi:hypothetical protein
MAATPTPQTLRIAAPRQLRLSALLAELCGDAARRAAGAPPPTHDGAVVIDSADGLTVGEILDATAHAGFGFVVAQLALVAIPFVGLSTPFGLAVAFVGLQIVIGKDRPWLPQRIRRRQISVAALDRITRWLTRWTRWMTPLVKPRWPRWTSRAGFVAIGVGLVIQGVGLALPIPIPGSNLMFVVPILVYAIGVLDEDGLLVAIAHAATLANIVLIIALWQGVAAALVGTGRWLGL